jgi:hypothetical protein
MAKNFHEEFDRPELPLPSDRSTGLVFAAVAGIVAYLWRTDALVYNAALWTAGALVAISLIVPIVIRPLNIAWVRFGILLSKVMNPIVMMVLFLIAIVPTGLLMQLRYDPLRRKRPQQDSYWIERKKDGISSMTNQF